MNIYSDMAAAALVLEVVFLVVAFGLRTAMQLRRTGSSGWRGFSRSGSGAGDVGGVLFAVALVLALVAPIADLAGWVEPIDGLDGTLGHGAGLVLTVLGGAGTVLAQLAMGDSWRIGVDASERTDLVTRGPFQLVRNPIFTAMLMTALGLALLVPNALSLAALGLLVVGLELHVRLVEEPYLVRTHGDRYRSYASRTGRFVPGFGRRLAQ